MDVEKIAFALVDAMFDLNKMMPLSPEDARRLADGINERALALECDDALMQVYDALYHIT